MVKATEDEIRLFVKYGVVSLGEHTARISVTIARNQLALSRADKVFCNRRLDSTITLGAHDEAAEQTKLIADTDYEINGAADVKGFKVSEDEMRIGLTFSKKDVPVEDLSRFASGTGYFTIHSAGEIPEPLPAEPPIKTSGQQTLKAKGPWRKVKIDTLFDPTKTVCKALADAGIETVGQLADYTGAGKLLGDLDGLGPKKVEEIEARMVEFWKSNPDADNQPEAAEAAAE